MLQGCPVAIWTDAVLEQRVAHLPCVLLSVVSAHWNVPRRQAP